MRRNRSLAGLLTLCLAAIAASAAWSDDRHLAVVVDTSGSMEGNDPQRYTMQLSKILGDLVDDSDVLTIVRMSDDGSCSAGVSSSLALRLHASDRAAFKAALAHHTRCDTGTNYSAAIRTAIDVLSHDISKQRMLLILADSGGLDCTEALTRELLSLRQSGATVAAINIGMTVGGFDGNPAIDFTQAARDAGELVEAVAVVYQRFLGTKKVQTGDVHKGIEVEIPPYTREAFLVVAADGTISALEQGLQNPATKSIDLNYRGGGRALGRDGKTRAYRIVHLLGPSAGRYTFKVPGLNDPAGWMLLVDSSVAVRMISTPTAARGVPTPVELEVYDQETGKRITDLSDLPDLDLTVEIDGTDVRLNDDGRDGDRKAGDGILTGMATFMSSGNKQVPVRLQSDLLDRAFTLETEVLAASWAVTVRTPPRAEIESPVELSLEIRPQGDRSILVVPDHFEVSTGAGTVRLLDDGQAPDATGGDGIYTGRWTPTRIGTVDLDYVPRGGQGAVPITAAIEVIGILELGEPRPIDLGRSGSDAELSSRLDLGSATVKGAFEVELSTNFKLGQTVLEIDLGQGFEPLGASPRPLRLVEGQTLVWPLRLRIGSCPEGTSAEHAFGVRVAGQDAAGQTVETTLPLTLEVLADPWWVCWWPVIAAGLAMAATGVAIHGFVSPSRFPPRLGIVLSPEEDLEGEGFFHPIRAQQGSRSGFYRDARIYITHDFRLTANAQGALARLRAHGKQVYIEPATGSTLWRQNAEGAWESLPQEETPARSGVIYKNDLGSLFFTVRNG